MSSSLTRVQDVEQWTLEQIEALGESERKKYERMRQMRTLTEHKVNEANEAIDVNVLDEPGQGGACHHYEIRQNHVQDGPVFCDIKFQNGPIKEFGVNGITHEALLAILADRLRSFQAGPYTCKENSVALTHIETAQLWLQKRTRERLARGVEGTHAK